MKIVNQQDILAYAHWVGMNEPTIIGTLHVSHIRGKRAFSFEYNKEWLRSKWQKLLDPDISWVSGPLFPVNKPNFGVFLDSMPDTWGRTLMKRRAIIKAKEKGEPSTILTDIDYLLGVHDYCRMGAIRFKTNPNGPFLDNNDNFPTPPWIKIRELQYSAEIIENSSDDEEIKQWLAILLAPGSSLGGARPKANILDTNNNLWIAKFPSKNDAIDKALWEYLTYKLAIMAGVEMSDSTIQKISGKHFTFFTKRFDRQQQERIHFASAMTMTGNNEEFLRDNQPSYLEIAEFIKFSGTEVTINLQQLWRRIVFNIAISNTDDHLRNHGFLLKPKGWVLSPAFDLNPSVDKSGLALNIDLDNNSLDFDLLRSVGQYFQLTNNQMNSIIEEVKNAVKTWRVVASDLGMLHNEQELMAAAFRV